MTFVHVGRIAVPARVAARLWARGYYVWFADEALLLQIPGSFVVR